VELPNFRPLKRKPQGKYLERFLFLRPKGDFLVEWDNEKTARKIINK